MGQILIFLFITMSAQVACIIHLFKHDRWMRWLMPLIFIPLSPIVYFVCEILPDLLGEWKQGREERKVTAPVDAHSELSEATRALDRADSAANNLRLADAYAALGRHADAVTHYERATFGGTDFRTGEKLARSLFLTDQPDRALAVLDANPAGITSADRDRIGLLRARILEELGRHDEALPIYADVSQRLAGEEALCRYAALLLKVGYADRARLALEEVEHRSRRRSQQQRAAQAPMYDWAMKELGVLRTT